MKTVRKFLTFFPVMPLLLAYSYIFTLYRHNIGELTLKVLPLPVSVITVVWVAVWLLLVRVFRDKNKAAVFFAVLTVLMFTYGDSLGLIGDRIFQIGGLSLRKNQIAFPAYLLLLVLTITVLKRMRSVPGSVYRYLLLVSLFAAVVPLVGIVKYEATERSRDHIVSHFRVPQVPRGTVKPEQLPDIYYIVPDSYGAPSVFAKYFGADDSEIIRFLESRGFYVATDATSNYPKTYLSLSSTLNMEYLDYLSVYKNSTDETLIDPLIKNNNVLRFLKSQGYAYYQMGSWWGPTQYNPAADGNYNLDLQNPAGINAFNSIIIQETLLRPVLPERWFASVVTESVEDKRRRVLYQFRTLPEVAKLLGPKFVFAHILAPHGPNVFGKNCEFITQESLWGKPDELGYTDQVFCVNRMLETAVDAILKNSVKPPVILIEADEGAPFLASWLKPMDNWKDASTDILRKKFPILAAYYLPGENKKSALYPSITPVNAFRVILNAYFPTDMPLLEDKNYINLDMDHRYEFRDVTDEVHGKGTSQVKPGK